MPSGSAVGTVDRHAAPPSKPATSSSFRADIQGLRMVAVVAVVLDHFVGWPLGGFIGVDVFFVISGFLITSILVREFARDGWISLQDFYVRRVKRIIPAAALVIAVTVLVAFVVWYPPRAMQTLLDGVAALFFASNWHFIRLGTDYLQADAPPSPLQHYWSLAVEEQFYIVWPLLTLGVCLLAARAARRRTDAAADGASRLRTRYLLTAMGAVAVLSFAWAMYASAEVPAFAYFDVFSRMWELAAGAMLALVVGRLPGTMLTGRIAGPVLAWTGLLTIAGGAILLDPGVPFPGPWALVPVIGTVLVIVGGTGRTAIAPLGNRVAQYTGKISYSLYLWHFPVIVFLEALLPGDPLVAIGIATVLTIVLSDLSYRFVERPALRSRWLSSIPALSRRGQLVLALGIGLVLVAASLVQVRGPLAITSATALGTALGTQRTAADATLDPLLVDEASVRDAVAAAVESDEWPAVDLASVSLGLATPEMSKVSGCRNDVGTSEPLVCDEAGRAPASPTAVVIGDSVALSWVPAVREALPGWRIVAVGYANCPAVLARVGEGERADDCAAAQDEMLALAESVSPELLFTSSAQSSLERLASGAEGKSATAEWADGVEAFIDRAASVSPNVVLLGNPPSGLHPEECLTRFSAPSACESELDAAWHEKAAVEASVAEASGATYVDVLPWFCTADGRCPMAIGDTILRYDGAHLTYDASTSFGELLRAALGR